MKHQTAGLAGGRLLNYQTQVAVGTTVAVQQKLMRHADVRTTMNTYGDVVTDEMALATSKVVCLAIPAVTV